MRYHYDWEFKDSGTTIEPISLGMVADDGRELYMIYRPAINAFRLRKQRNQLDQTDKWLEANVFNHISFKHEDEYGYDNKERMAVRVYDFIVDGLGRGEQAELWGYFAAYDHVCLSQLFGRMIDLPSPMPMYTNELMTIKRERPKPKRPAYLPEHSAVADAKYQKLIYESWSQ